MLLKKVDITKRTLKFGIEIDKLSKKFIQRYPLSTIDQIIKSSTAIGANVHEAQGARTKKEFCSIMGIARKESQETDYWLNHFLETERGANQKLIQNLIDENEEIVKIITTIRKNALENLKKTLKLKNN
ncbi:four helix bundle protein [Patescibacteria group bacterium]